MKVKDSGLNMNNLLSNKNMKRRIISSLIGNALEWYDFFLYGTAAAVVFGGLFFPFEHNSLLGTLIAFSGFTVGFIARPLGGIIFGHMGDTKSRKDALIYTLILMGVCTFLIGLLPTYKSIGVAAPILLILLRFVQGIASGGEWGGGVLILTETAPSSKKGFYTAFSQMGVSGGFVLSSFAFWLTQLLPYETFISWGWRLPFLASFILLIVGIYIRKNIEESASFTQEKNYRLQKQNKIEVPFISIFRYHLKPLLQAIALRMPENGAVYLFFTFSIVYCRHINIPLGDIISCVTIAMTVETFAILFWGWLGDKIGFKTVYYIGVIGLILIAFPFFWLLNQHNYLAISIATLLGLPFCHGAMIGSQPCLITDLFPSESRYTGLSLGHEIGSIFAGGIGPILAVALLIKFDSYWPISIMIIFWALCAIWALSSFEKNSKLVSVT